MDAEISYPGRYEMPPPAAAAACSLSWCTWCTWRPWATFACCLKRLPACLPACMSVHMQTWRLRALRMSTLRGLASATIAALGCFTRAPPPSPRHLTTASCRRRRKGCKKFRGLGHILRVPSLRLLLGSRCQLWTAMCSECFHGCGLWRLPRSTHPVRSRIEHQAVPTHPHTHLCSARQAVELIDCLCACMHCADAQSRTSLRGSWLRH